MCSLLVVDVPQAYELRGAGAVLHSHSLHAVIATMLNPQATEFKVTHLEMIKVCTARNVWPLAMAKLLTCPPSTCQHLFNFNRNDMQHRAELSQAVIAT